MTKEEAIKYLKQLYPNGGHCWLDEQRIEAIGMAVKVLQEEPVSEELEEASFDYAEACKYDGGEKLLCVEHFKAGAKWQKENLWKSADGEDLPEYDREVIALIKYNAQHNIHDEEYPTYRVGFGLRPNKYAKVWNSVLGEEQVVEIEGYDKGGWNIPDVKYWLDVKLPKEIEL